MTGQYTSEVILSVESVYKSYGKRSVLENVNFSLHQGEVLVIVGQSGCGKSTLLRTLNGLEPIQSGDIRFHGESLVHSKVNWKKVHQKIGMVFQSYDLFPHLNVLQNMLLGPLQVQKRDRTEATRQARALLERIGLADRERAMPRQLSGGQKQRIAIIRSLCMNPEIMLFDEVTAALDPIMVSEVLDVIRELAHGGMTMIIVTHEMGFARAIADRVLFLDSGRVVETTPGAHFFTRPASMEAQAFLDKLLIRQQEVVPVI